MDMPFALLIVKIFFGFHLGFGDYIARSSGHGVVIFEWRFTSLFAWCSLQVIPNYGDAILKMTKKRSLLIGSVYECNSGRDRHGLALTEIPVVFSLKKALHGTFLLGPPSLKGSFKNLLIVAGWRG